MPAAVSLLVPSRRWSSAEPWSNQPIREKTCSQRKRAPKACYGDAMAVALSRSAKTIQH